MKAPRATPYDKNLYLINKLRKEERDQEKFNEARLDRSSISIRVNITKITQLLILIDHIQRVEAENASLRLEVGPLNDPSLLSRFLWNRHRNDRTWEISLEKIKKELISYRSRPAKYKLNSPKFPILDNYSALLEEIKLVGLLENNYLKSFLLRYDSSDSSESDESTPEETIIAHPAPGYY